MKKSELIEILNSIEGDPEVIMSKDAEGNDYSPCANYMHPAKYVPVTTWYGNIYNPEDKEQDEYWEDDNSTIDAIVLWPTN